ncbi:hypothetical protein Bca52824_048778, partial [Brassica carinata]
VGSSSVSRNSATASEHLFNRNAARVDWRIDNPISDILIDSPSEGVELTPKLQFLSQSDIVSKAIFDANVLSTCHGGIE